MEDNGQVEFAFTTYWGDRVLLKWSRDQTAGRMRTMAEPPCGSLKKPRLKLTIKGVQG